MSQQKTAPAVAMFEVDKKVFFSSTKLLNHDQSDVFVVW